MPTCYAALENRVVVASGDGDGDGEWDGREVLQEHDVECVAAGGGRAFVGTVDGGLQRSTDGGDAWTTVLDVEHRVTAVTVTPQHPDHVWVGTEPSRVFRSTDGGETWAERPGLTDLDSSNRWSFPPRPHTHHVRWIAVDPRVRDRLYVAIEAGAVVRTDDGGVTWRDHPTGARRDNHTLRTHPDAPGRVYAAAGDGYAESLDGGDTWQYPQVGLDHRYVWGLAVHPDDPDVVVASAARGPRSAHDADGESYVYRRTGDRWELAMEGLPDPDGLARAVLATDERGFYALTNRGLYRSEAGEAWRRCPVPWSGAYERRVPSGLAVVG